eukprot:SAG31_NODE_3576_length_4107_cov_4.203593_2_plen_164_part_00
MLLRDNGTKGGTQGYSTLLYAARAVALIENHSYATGPLFLYLAFQAVHAPTQVPTQYVTPYNFDHAPRNIFAGMLSCLDEAVGNITNALSAQGQWMNTLFILTTVGQHKCSRFSAALNLTCSCAGQWWCHARMWWSNGLTKLALARRKMHSLVRRKMHSCAWQ